MGPVLDISVLLFAKICVVVRCMYCTLPLAAKYRHVILHCICLVKLIELMLILVQLKWSSAYQIQCPIHLVSIRVLTIVRMRAFKKSVRQNCCVRCVEAISKFGFPLYKNSPYNLNTVNFSEWTPKCKWSLTCQAIMVENLLLRVGFPPVL